MKRIDVPANQAPHLINGSQGRILNTGDSNQSKSLFSTTEESTSFLPIETAGEMTDKISLCKK